MKIASDEIMLSQWGNSKAIRLPATLANLLNFNVNDKLSLNVEISETGEKQLIVKAVSQAQTIEELFKDYEDDGTREPIIEFEPMGNELW